MAIHSHQIIEYLDAHPISRHEGDFNSLLEMLFSAYTDCNPIDSEQLRARFHAVDELLSKLSFEDAEKLYSLVYSLCFEFEHISFYNGLSAGMHLMTELSSIL